MPLNAGQQAAFGDCIEHLNDPNRKYHFISGGAGVGKSYFIAEICNSLLRYKKVDNPIWKVELTATTNTAAAVISDSLTNNHTAVGTIHSFMNLRLSHDYNTGEAKCIPTAKWEVHSGTYLIIDECSMIDKSLLKYIMEGTDSTCKVLFVGDKNQLAPIKEELSGIYTRGYSASYLNVSVRNAEQPALMDLCTQLKETVETGVFTPILPVPGVIDYMRGAALQGFIERTFLDEDRGNRILCYTNRKVKSFNQFVRKIRGYTEPFEPGEIISNNEAAILPGKIPLYTDQMFRVNYIETTVHNTEIIPGHTFEMLVLNISDVRFGTPYSVTVFASIEDRQDVLNHFKRNKKWLPFYKIKEQYPDFRPVSASTTHKAQGSTFDTVVVDMDDIAKSTNKGQTARMQYVACSRPKRHLIIKGELPARYFE